MTTKLSLDVKLSDYIELDTHRNVETIDFTIECDPSLKSITKYDLRGKKVSTNYLDRNTDDLIVKKDFIEDYPNFLLNIIFTWYDRQDKVYATKTKVIDMPDEGQWEARFRKQRERIMDDLKGRAKKYNSEHYVDILYAYFKDEKQDFVETGSLMFANAVAQTLQEDISEYEPAKKQMVGTVQAILNNSLDGTNKVYETLIYLTSL